MRLDLLNIDDWQVVGLLESGQYRDCIIVLFRGTSGSASIPHLGT